MRSPEEIDKIADNKIIDAEKILTSNNHWSTNNARYLAGYAIELTLKAKICRHLEMPELFSKEKAGKDDVSFPFRSHNLDNLLIYAGLKRKHSEALEDAEHYKMWQLVVNWKTNLRYIAQNCEHSRGTDFLKAVKYIQQWIRKN